jgi:hypothetical protein
MRVSWKLSSDLGIRAVETPVTEVRQGGKVRQMEWFYMDCWLCDLVNTGASREL